jgi:succinyl-CoA synthetase beta subunit
VGGSSNPEKVVRAFDLILEKGGIKTILINIFGGITRCDDIANGIVEALKQIKLELPMVIRLIGTNDEEGRKILEQNGLESYQSLGDAVEKVVAASGAKA